MELLIMCYACKTSCSRNIIGVIPYLPYSKQSKMFYPIPKVPFISYHSSSSVLPLRIQ